MSVKILTSMFHNGFPDYFANYLKRIVGEKDTLAFVASEFESMHEKTDRYFYFFLGMFKSSGITFKNAYVVDGRMTKEQAQKATEAADVIWLAGGDTPTQYGYFIKYGLVPVLQRHGGVIIGMSAGAINMGKTAICTFTCEHMKKQIYEALNLVDISVEPHFDKSGASEELLELSQEYRIYGLCDEAVILCVDDICEYMGDVFLLEKGNTKQISRADFV